MRKIKAFDFEIVKLKGPHRLCCRYLTDNDTITLLGNSVEEIFQQCLQTFPEGLDTRGFVFSGISNMDAKRNLSEFLSIGFKTGYFKQEPMHKKESETDETES